METGSITWTGPEDDKTAKVGNYVLRVEEMDRNNWWWACYYQHDEIRYGAATHIELAKNRAINAMKEHLKEK